MREFRKLALVTLGLWLFLVVGSAVSRAQGPGLINQLRIAVLERYPSSNFDMRAYRIIPYGSTYFAVTSDGTVYAVWEWLDGRWSWIFPFTSSQDQSSLDYSFREARFSAKMQAKLGGNWSIPVTYKRF